MCLQAQNVNLVINKNCNIQSCLVLEKNISVVTECRIFDIHVDDVKNVGVNSKTDIPRCVGKNVYLMSIR